MKQLDWLFDSGKRYLNAILFCERSSTTTTSRLFK